MESFDIASIISIASLVINIAALALVLLGVLLGLKRGLLHSLLRLGAAVCALITSIVAARYLRGSVYGVIEQLLEGTGVLSSITDNSVLTELTEASPTAAQLIKELPAALVAPLLFLVAFLILNFIFYIVYKILKRMTAFSKKLFAKAPPVGRLLGALVSCAASFIIVVCFLAPFSGYVSFADSIIQELEDVEIDESVDATILDIDQNYLTPIKENTALATAGVIMNPIVFDSVTSCRFNGFTVVWSDEVAYLAANYASLKPLIDSGLDFANLSKTEADALRAFADTFDDSQLVPHIAAEILPAMAGKWNEGEAFLGITHPAEGMTDQIKPLMTSVVNILATTTYETLPADLTTMTELLATLIESGTFAMLGSDISTQDIVATLSKPGLISGLIDIIYANERTEILVTDIANLGFDAISESLEIPASDEAVRATLAVELNDAVKQCESIENYDEKITALSGSIENLFVKYGVESDKATAKLYAECIIGVGPISSDNPDSIITDYFTIISAALSESPATTMLPSPVFAATPVNAKVKEAVAAYLATADSDAAINAKLLCEQMKGTTALDHAIITLDDIHLSAEEMHQMSAEDVHKQSQSLEDIIGVLSTVMVFGDDGSFSIDIAKLDPDALADALFRLASTGTDAEGHEIHNIAHAITGVVKFSLYKVGIDAKSANNLVNHMTTVHADGTTKNPLSSALAVMNIVQGDKNLSSEDVMSNISTMVKELDSETAKVLADCISPNLINSFAPSLLPADQTEAIVNVTKDIVKNFGEQMDALSPEQLEAETAYMQTIFDLAVNAGSERTDGVFAGGEEGTSSTLDMTADTFVDTIKHSTIIANTFVSQTESLKIAVNDAMPEADKADLLTAIEGDTELSEDVKNALYEVFQLGTIGK